MNTYYKFKLDYTIIFF